MLTLAITRNRRGTVGAIAAGPGGGLQSVQATHDQSLVDADRLLRHLAARHRQDERAAVIELTRLVIYQRMAE